VQKRVLVYRQFTGNTRAVETVEIRARVPGRLEKREFEEGDYVKKDALLFRIDPEEYEVLVDQGQAAVEVAQAALKLAEATYSRMAEAAKTDAVSELSVLESEGMRDGAKATLEQRRAELDKLELDLKYTKMYAPISGRIGRSLVDDGNLVGYSEKTLLTTIVQLDPIYVDFDVNERDLLEIMARAREKKHQEHIEDRLEALRTIPIELGLANQGDAYPHKGRLYYADPTVDPGTGTLLVRGDIPNPEPAKILPGLFARVRVALKEPIDALLITERAIGTDQRGKYLLVLGKENVVEYRSVVLGPKDGTMRVIESGVEPEDRVIVNGMLRARPGEKVTPMEAKASAAMTDEPSAHGQGVSIQRASAIDRSGQHEHF